MPKSGSWPKRTLDVALSLCHAHLLRIHGRGAEWIDDNHVGSSIRVDKVPTITLAQCVQNAGLVEVDEAGQVLHPVARWRIGLTEKGGKKCG